MKKILLLLLGAAMMGNCPAQEARSGDFEITRPSPSLCDIVTMMGRMGLILLFANDNI